MFKIDLHVHSTLGGDSHIRPDQVVECARKAGLDAVCVTEHHSYDLSQPFDEISKSTGFPILRGMEYRAHEGHLLIYGVSASKGDFMPGLPMQTVLKWVNDQGGVAIPAHPYQRGILGSALGDKVFELKGLEALETINASATFEENSLSIKAAQKLGLTGIAGSDAHGAHALGRAWTCFPSPITDAKALAIALREGNYSIAAKDGLYD
jgi:predicted metal-dependent phosphoesterase TrpH